MQKKALQKQISFNDDVLFPVALHQELAFYYRLSVRMF